MKIKDRLRLWLFAKVISIEGPKMFKKILGANWKTNAAGLSMYLVALAAILKCFTCVDCGDKMTCIIAAAGAAVGGSGFFAAKDNNVTGGTVVQ